MDADPLITVPVQPGDVLDLGRETAVPEIHTVEPLSEVWNAAESLASPELEMRWMGMKCLTELDAPRRYPLVAYLLATRLTEPDIALRARVVEALGGLLRANDTSEELQAGVFASLITYLGAMRNRSIYSLLQVAEFDTANEPMVAALLSYCSYAGEHMGNILSNRDAPIEIRWQAAHFIGRLGFLDALPTLERLVARMDLRNHGRAPDLERFDEANLLLEMRQAIEILKAP